MKIFISILSNSIVPIFILIALGFVLDKKFDLNIATLSKINFYLFVPAFAFCNLYTTAVSKELLNIILFASAFLCINFILGKIITLAAKMPKNTACSFNNAIMFYNSGNIGVPLATLVFSSAPFIIDGQTPFLELALSAQFMVMLVQTLTTNTIGFINGGGENATVKSGIARVLKMPTVYAITLAFLLKLVPVDITETTLWPALTYFKNGMVSVALTTIGVQLSKTRLDFKRKVPYIAVILRLIGGPAIAFFLVKLFGFQGIIAQCALISSSVPTAVNTALIAVECGGDTDFCAQTVMLSTLFSAVTMTCAVFMANILFPV